MKVHIDSGVFIDYLIGRGHTSSYLRSTERRGREPARLCSDAEACLTSIVERHEGITSSLTCYEMEEALYRELRRSAFGVPNADRFIIPAARAVVVQTLGAIDLFNLRMVDLRLAVVTAQCGNMELQKRGIRAADSLHVSTALAEREHMLITTDGDLIALDNVFEGPAGTRLRCVDTDEAASLL